MFPPEAGKLLDTFIDFPSIEPQKQASIRVVKIPHRRTSPTIKDLKISASPWCSFLHQAQDDKQSQTAQRKNFEL
jgi:hypothetical protein